MHAGKRVEVAAFNVAKALSDVPNANSIEYTALEGKLT